jgi:hypothetical protein
MMMRPTEPTVNARRVQEMVDRARTESWTAEEFQRALDELLAEAGLETAPPVPEESVAEQRIRSTARKARKLS